jgi:hypothetical protein
MFSGYKGLCEHIDSKYGGHYQNYPYAMLALDRVLRYTEAAKLYKPTYDCSSFAIRDWNNLFSLNPKQILYNSYRRLTNTINSKKQNAILCPKLERFPAILSSLRQFESDYNFAHLDSWGLSLKNAKSLLTLNTLPIESTILGTRRIQNVLKKCRISGFSKTLDSPSLLEELNITLRRQASSIADTLKKTGVRIIITTSDSSAASRLFCKAAQDSGAKTVVISHGYITDDWLLTICPIQADKLLVWTTSQERELKRVLSSEQKNKIVYLGFPRTLPPRKSPETDAQHKHALLLLGYIGSEIETPHTRLNILSFLHAVTESQGVTKLRIHPKDLENKPLLDVLKSRNLEPSLSTLDQDITNSYVAMGFNTSSLIESFFNLVPTFKVREFESYGFMEIPNISISEIPSVIISNRNHSTPFSLGEDYPFSTYDFHTFLLKQLETVN